MQRRATTLIATGALGLGAALGLTACGDDEDSTTEDAIEQTTETTVTTETEQTTTEGSESEPSEGGAYGY